MKRIKEYLIVGLLDIGELKPKQIKKHCLYSIEINKINEINKKYR